MSTLIEKFFGYILLCVGIACILFAFSGMYGVFTGTANPPEIFKMQSLDLKTTPSGVSEPVAVSVPLGPDIRKIADMFLYYLLMVFVVIVGAKISSLGIQLVKEIKVKVKKD
jgi:hypothetical protein